jgi:hypothetical protein
MNTNKLYTELTGDNTFEKHQEAFKHVRAAVVTDKEGNLVARVAFKRSRSNLRTTCYFHIIGLPMFVGVANGGGYDKESASAHVGARRTIAYCNASELMSGEYADIRKSAIERHKATALAFDAAIKDTGKHWDTELQDIGYNVYFAV